MNKWIFPIVITVGAILIRLFPHMPNFAPIGAMALFGGACLNRRYSLLIVFATMLISDYLLLYINPFSSQWINFSKIYPLTTLFHSTSFFIYASFLVYYLIGRLIANNRTFATVGVGSFIGSIQFFLITNTAVWIMGAYARDLSGLGQSYVMGIPFFRNTLLGDLFYTGAFFGSYEFVRVLILRFKPTYSK